MCRVYKTDIFFCIQLDGPNAGKVINPNEEEDEKDFYEEGIGG